MTAMDFRLQPKKNTLENIYLLAFLVTGQFLKLHVWDIWDVLSKANSGWTTLYNTDEKQKGSM